MFRSLLYCFTPNKSYISSGTLIVVCVGVCVNMQVCAVYSASDKCIAIFVCCTVPSGVYNSLVYAICNTVISNTMLCSVCAIYIHVCILYIYNILLLLYVYNKLIKKLFHNFYAFL